MAGLRVGLVLGSGGLAGTAFHAGLLTALADRGWDARDAEVVVGTSAGSTSAALLRGGFPPGDYVRRLTGEPMSDEGQRLLGAVPPLQSVQRRPPRPLPASARLLAGALRRPGALPVGVLAAAALPVGATPNADVAAVIGPLHPAWPDRPLWVCAVRLDTGARVVFGRDADAPQVSVAEAVEASCAIPGFYAPPVLGGVRHVDGGVWSLCNLDLVAGLGLDLVVVSAPMASTAWVDRSRDAGMRALARAQLAREVRAVRRSGTPVLVVEPDARARAVMTGTGMDATKRPAIARRVRDTVLDGLDHELLERLTG